ncbi:MAG: methylenetetrahydrofolate--tRNA-(uracil(54)-C(5))-methyltransferase (FADH(2)-oxidizing) TrmFO [Clostridiales bacterium]|nr:methylenetetrahydrofolate--tRNA-(uracil(54)-C(5))-methyltransferase (FADH(2)-oxidizing) TrmFO [Clostridiales bacterium]
MAKPITVIGAGLAGVEAAWRIAGSGYDVVLREMKPARFSPAHQNPDFAELVCSNSLKAERLESAAGLLKAEMAHMGSLCVEAAYACRVPAGGALAVERHAFARYITEKIKSHPRIRVVHEIVTTLPPAQDAITIVATGPLTDGPLAQEISALTGDLLSFYDAAAPIVTAQSVDRSIVFGASRYERGGEDDYLNCPFNKEEYEAFHQALAEGERAQLHAFEREMRVYEGCMPIEVLAGRGADTMRFGPMKPVGLRDPRTGHRPWAVAQLRRENAEGSLYNLVGFQTNLKFGEQKRIFSMIPGLRNAEFVRYGVMHRNSFIDSPRLLNGDLSLKARPNLFFAGQITGVEGYMESACCGILAGMNAVRRLEGRGAVSLPPVTMSGALMDYLCDKSIKDFQPMGANFGILPKLEPHIRDKKERYAALAARGMDALKHCDLQ